MFANSCWFSNGVESSSDFVITEQSFNWISSIKKERKLGSVGNTLICRTVIPSKKIKHAEIETEVQDSEGYDTIRLRLENYCYAGRGLGKIEEKSCIPPGSFLALENPLVSLLIEGHGIGLKCEDPKSVILLAEFEVQQLLKESSVPVDGSFPNEGISLHLLFWNCMKDVSPEVKVENLKAIGNTAYKEGMYTDALRWYRIALVYVNCSNSGEKEDHKCLLWNNVSAALIGLGCWKAALFHLEKVLSVDKDNKKALYRTAKCLTELENFKDAIELLCRISSPCQEILDLLEKAKKLFVLSGDPLRLKQIWAEHHLQPKSGLDGKAEFVFAGITGPIYISSTKDKGRGYFSSRRVKRGEIILAEKAFAHVTISSEDNARNGWIDGKSSNSNLELLEVLVSNKLCFDASFSESFFSLTAGNSVKESDTGKGSMGKLRRILLLNSFGYMDKEKEENALSLHTGIWLKSSYFNHSCSEANCLASFVRDWIIVIAVREIRKGEELTIPYMTATAGYEKRINCCRLHEFTCCCELCSIQREETSSVKEERENLIREGQSLEKEGKSGRRSLEILKRLKEMHNHSPELNIYMLQDSQLQLIDNLNKNKQFRESLPFLMDMIKVTERIPTLFEERLKVCTRLVYTYLGMNDIKNARKWTNESKMILKEFYGKDCKAAVKDEQ